VNEAIFKVYAAIECLADLGMSSDQIQGRINTWIDKQGVSVDWLDLPEAGHERLAKAIQKYFEDEFNKRRDFLEQPK
jgi:hypothetical protein